MPGVGRCASVGQKCTENQNANWRLLGQNSPWIMDMTHWPRNGHSRLVLGFQEGEKLNTPLWTPAHCDHPRPPQFHWFLQIWDINLLETKKGSNMPYKHWFIKVWDYPTPPTYIWINGSKFSGIFWGGFPYLSFEEMGRICCKYKYTEMCSHVTGSVRSHLYQDCVDRVNLAAFKLF